MKVDIGGYLENGRVLGWRVDTNPPREGRGWEYRHTTGFYTDEYGDSDLIFPCVVLVPGRGRYAGATMGEGMATWVDTSALYGADETADVWGAAWQVADCLAERERDYQASLCRTCFEPPATCGCPIHPFTD